MARPSIQSVEARAAFMELLALNALFDAARAGESAREAALAVQAVAQTAKIDLVDPESDEHLRRCYDLLLEATPRPPRLS